MTQPWRCRSRTSPQRPNAIIERCSVTASCQSSRVQLEHKALPRPKAEWVMTVLARGHSGGGTHPWKTHLTLRGIRVDGIGNQKHAGCRRTRKWWGGTAWAVVAKNLQRQTEKVQHTGSKYRESCLPRPSTQILNQVRRVSPLILAHRPSSDPLDIVV
jgi:hypothetical protein